MGQEGFSILILGAGKATRFKSAFPKLLHPLAGRLMGEYVLRTAEAAGAERVYMIIGHQAEAMRNAFTRTGVEFIEQKEQLGTGHALIVARPELESCPSGVVVALVGDVPKLQPETLRSLVATHRQEGAACTILTMSLETPTGYGRIVRVGGKRVRAIVEEKVASATQKKIREVSTGILCFSRQPLLAHLGELSCDNAQKEYLLTDLIEIFNRDHLRVAAFQAPAEEAMGINDRAQLAAVGKSLFLRRAVNGLGRERRHEAVVRVGKIEDQVVRLLFHTGDHDQSFAEVRLRLARCMRQRHEHLPAARLFARARSPSRSCSRP